MASSRPLAGRTPVGREVAANVGHPLALGIKRVLEHPQLEGVRRNKIKILFAILLLPKLVLKLRLVLKKAIKNAIAAPPADFRGKWVQIMGGEIGVTKITQTGRSVSIVNATQFWSPAEAEADGETLTILKPDIIKGYTAKLTEGGKRLEFSAGTVWQLQEGGKEEEDAAVAVPVQQATPQAAPPPKPKRAPPTTMDLLRGPSGSMGYEELVAAGCMALVASLFMTKKAHLLGQLLALSYEPGYSKRWLSYAVGYPIMALLSVSLVDGCGYMTSRIALKWRRNLTNKLHDKYFSRMRYYRILNESNGEIPDPDMRICADVKTFTNSLAGMSVSLVTAMVHSLAFGRAAIRNRHWSWSFASPLYFAVALAHIMKSESWKRYAVMGELAKCEGKFTASLSRLQLHAERVCMLQGESYECNLLAKIVSQIHELLRSNASLSLFRDTVEASHFHSPYGAAYIELTANFVAGCMAANTVVARDGTSAAQDSSVAHIWVPGQFGTFLEDMHAFFNAGTGWGAFIQAWLSYVNFGPMTKRISEFYAHLENLEVGASDSNANSDVFSDCGPVISFDNVTIQTPTKQVLLEGLTLEVKEGDSLLICGHNGAGKSSIIRSLCNLWPIPVGKIARPGGASQAEENSQLHDEIYYLPQKPCNVLGTLSDQLTYPLRPEGGLPDDELRRWLSYVDLEYLADRKVSAVGMSRVTGNTDESAIDWEVLLSMGEQQALSIARLLYHHPRFAILDECTSAVGKTLEARLFELAKELGITCLTITHRPALKDHHAKMLFLSGSHGVDGKGWELSSLPHEKPLAPMKPRCADVAEVHDRIQNHLKWQRGRTQADKTQIDKDSTERALTEKRSEMYAQEGKESSTTPARDVVLKRWPGRLSRMWAIVSFGLQTQEQQRSAIRRVALMCVLMTARVKVYWDYWRGLAGIVQGGLSGNITLVFANAMCSFVNCFASSLLDNTFKYQVTTLSIDVLKAIQDRINEQVMRRGTLLKLMNPKGIEHMGAVENPVLRLSELKGVLDAMAFQIRDVVPPVVQGLSMLPWMFRGLGYVTPGLLLANFFLFRGSQLIAPDFPKIQERETALESRFQVLHSRLRSISEAVAFSGGGAAERRIVEPRLEDAMKHREFSCRREVLYNMMVSMFTDYRQLPLWAQRLASIGFIKSNSTMTADGAVSAEMVVSNFLFDRAIQFSQVGTQKLVRIVEASGRIDGQCIRCLELVEACNIASSASISPEAAAVPKASDPAAAEKLTISVKNLDLVTPRGICLAKDLSFDAVAGVPMVVTGPNATGKTLLGSVLLGLWSPAGPAASISVPGAVNRCPPLSLLMPAPQQIYLPYGNLISQLLYPDALAITGDEFKCYVRGLPDGTSKEDLLSLFAAVGAVAAHVVTEGPFSGIGLVYFPSLEALLLALVHTPKIEGAEIECDLPWPGPEPRPAGLPVFIRARKCFQACGIDHILTREKKGWLAESAWEDVLSGGEKQRLCLARVLYHKPTFALLDECTSMVAADSEEDLYRKLFHDWNITPIVLTQRLFMTDFYDKELSLGVQSAAGWDLMDVEGSTK